MEQEPDKQMTGAAAIDEEEKTESVTATATNSRLPSDTSTTSIASPKHKEPENDKILLQQLKSILHQTTEMKDLGICCGTKDCTAATIEGALQEMFPEVDKVKDKASDAATNGNGTDKSAASTPSTTLYNQIKNAQAEQLAKTHLKVTCCNGASAPASTSDMDTSEFGSSSSSKGEIRGKGLLPSTLENLTKPLIDRKEFGEVNLKQIAEGRADDIQGAAADQEYAHTTEPREYIKQEPEFIIPGPNPMRIPHDELFNAFKGFNNMFLAHEISLNPDFRVERYIPPPESIESRVQIQLKRAFWDLFNEEIHKNPPEYKRAIEVFKEVKETILGVLLPHNTRTRDVINRELDVELISQSIDHDVFTHEDFKRYTHFIIQTLSQLCSPSRDGDIEDLKKLDDPALIFEGILELAEKMKLDIANFYIEHFRPIIISHCAQYERVKFADFLGVERRLGEDGLRTSRNWLARHTIDHGRNGLPPIFAKAFSELLAIEFDDVPPATLALDIGRFRQAAQKFLRLTIVGAILVTGSGHLHAIIGDTPEEVCDLLTKQIKIIVTDEDVIDASKLNDRIEAAAEQTLTTINEYVQKRLRRGLNATETDSLRQCIREIESPESKVRGLIYRRILNFAEGVFEAALSKQKTPFHERCPPAPAGLYAIGKDVMTLVGDLVQVVNHNFTVYGPLYMAIIRNEVGPITIFDENTEDPEFERVMGILHGTTSKRPPTVSESETGTTTY